MLKEIALLAYTTLRAQSMMIPDKLDAIGFCFEGAIALQAARAGAQFEVAVSLHGGYPSHDLANPAPCATKYFVEMIGYDDPLDPSRQ
jgi:dienelactone hydrolase